MTQAGNTQFLTFKWRDRESNSRLLTPQAKPPLLHWYHDSWYLRKIQYRLAHGRGYVCFMVTKAWYLRKTLKRSARGRIDISWNYWDICQYSCRAMPSARVIPINQGHPAYWLYDIFHIDFSSVNEVGQEKRPEHDTSSGGIMRLPSEIIRGPVANGPNAWQSTFSGISAFRIFKRICLINV